LWLLNNHLLLWGILRLLHYHLLPGVPGGTLLLHVLHLCGHKIAQKKVVV